MLAGVALLPGCIIVTGGHSHVARGSLAASTEAGPSRDVAIGELSRIDVTATPETLDLGSRNGSLVIIVDESATELRIAADVRCGGDDAAEAEARLASVTLDVVEQAGGVVQVRPRMPGGWRSGDGVNLEVRMPVSAAIIGRTSNGSIRIEGARGPIDLETTNGAIELRDTAGAVLARTSNGRIDVADHLGGLDIATSNGAITIRLNPDSDAPVVARTNNGPVEFRAGSAFGGVLDARTSNGRIQVDGLARIAGPTAFERHPGRVQLTLAGTSEGSRTDVSRLETSNGSIRIEVRD
jgi:hypothetical protein